MCPAVLLNLVNADRARARKVFVKVTGEVGRRRPRGSEVGDELANASHRRDARLERTAFAPMPLTKATDEAATRARSVPVDGTDAALVGAADGGESSARLLERAAGREDRETPLSRGRELLRRERDTPEERPIAAKSTRLAERRELVVHHGLARTVAARLRIEETRQVPHAFCVVTEVDLRSAGPARGVLRASSPDGRLETLRLMPPTRLSPFVHHLWWVRWALHTPFEAEALAHPSAQIVFEAQDDVRRATVAGVRTGRLAMRREGDGEAFGVTFRSAMFQPLLGASMTTITDRVVPLGHVLGSKSEAWARSIHAEADVVRKLAIVDAFLTPLLLPSDPSIARVRDLMERVARDRSFVRVEQVSEIAGGDVRALQRCFRKYVGVSPKWVIQRYRLHEAAEQLKARRPPTLAALAASLGYADQAHFARDFKLTVGQTPRAFARESSARRRSRPI